MNIAALVAANTSPTGSIDPAKIKARFPESESWPIRQGRCQLWSICRRAFWRSRNLCRRGRRRERCPGPPPPSHAPLNISLGQARISEIQEALQETKAVQEMKEQVHPSFISCKLLHIRSGKTSTPNRCQSHHGSLPIIHGTYLLAIQAKTPDAQEMEEQVCFSFVSCCTHENL